MLPEMRDGKSPYLKQKKFGEHYALDYFERSRRLWRHKAWLLGAPIAVCVLWLLVAGWRGDWRVFQAGPVSSVCKHGSASHASFGNECSRCHQEHFQTWKRLSPWHADLRSVPDTGCLACHPLFGPKGKDDLAGPPAPPHHANLVPAPRCAECHREHRGLPLAEVADVHCGRCHADLPSKLAQPRFQKVSTFADHPPFAVPERDPARLHFNHEAHLPPGGVLNKDGTCTTLTCAACHVPAAGGRYMQPINYEQHCARCHPLSVPLLGEGLPANLGAAVTNFRATPAPHKKPPREVREALRERYRTFVRSHPTVLPFPLFPAPPRPIPGQPAPTSGGNTEETWQQAQLAGAERMLFEGAGGCRFCHESKSAPRASALPEFEPTNVPTRWLAHASFKHDAPGHLALGCAGCHNVSSSSRTADVLLPKIDVCQSCHAPGKSASADCRLCHRYHEPIEPRSSR